MISMKTSVRRHMWSLILLKHQHLFYLLHIFQAFIKIIQIQDVLKTSGPLSPSRLSSANSSIEDLELWKLNVEVPERLTKLCQQGYHFFWTSLPNSGGLYLDVPKALRNYWWDLLRWLGYRGITGDCCSKVGPGWKRCVTVGAIRRLYLSSWCLPTWLSVSRMPRHEQTFPHHTLRPCCFFSGASWPRTDTQARPK